MTDRSIEAIDSSIGNLMARKAAIEEQIYELQIEHRHTVRAINAFKLALDMLK